MSVSSNNNRNNPALKRSAKSPTYLPFSLPLLLARRVEGQYQLTPRSFAIGVSRQLSPKSLVQDPQLITPQTQRVTAINSIHVDKVENRFVLAGGADAIISIYDLSKWGSEEYLKSTQANRYCAASQPQQRSTTTTSLHKPIASSRREAPTSVFTPQGITRGVETPSGHSSSISNVSWYLDSGAFLSSSNDGTLLIWDTDSMTPVAQYKPFDTKGIASLHFSTLRQYSAVVASFHDPALKLLDVRSGASSHTLLGHADPGVSSVQWAPHNDIILASGGLDGTVRLWDIRKAGGRSCVTVLNQDQTHPPRRAKPYHTDYSHIPKPMAKQFPSFTPLEEDSGRGKQRRNWGRKYDAPAAADLAPNNYHRSETTTVSSHAGAVSALTFGAGGDGHYLVSAGQDGNIHIWDLRGNGHLLPLRFLAPGRQPAISPQRKQSPLLLTPVGAGSTNSDHIISSLGACWVGNGSNLLGYSLERGGLPQKVFQGHLNGVTSIDAIPATAQILTAGRDGMILTWGKPDGQRQRKRKADEDSW